MSSIGSTALPVLTASIGTLGIGTGLYSITSPIDGDRLFGVVTPRPLSSSKELQTWHQAQAQARGIRNVASGLAIVSVTSFWRFSTMCRASPLASLAAKRCLGLMFLVGSIVGASDGWIISQFAESDNTSQEGKDVGKKSYLGHCIMAVPIFALGLSCFWT